MKRRDSRGFTLLELIIALALVGSLLAIAFGGLRVALAAWRQGEDRAEAHQEVRGIALMLARAVAASYPYQAALGEAPDAVVLFKGEAHRLSFVTEAPPSPFALPVAFAAVVLSLESGEQPGLAVAERALPNRNPFAQATVVLRDPGVTGLDFRYLDKGGSWQDTWDGENEKALPRAVEISVTTADGGRKATLPPVTVPLRTVTQ